MLWFFSTTAKSLTSAQSITLKKQELPPPPNSSKIYNYKNLDELRKHVTNLSLLSYWKINCSNTVYLYKIDPIYDNPLLDIFVGDAFNFIIRDFARCLPTDPETYKNYNSSVNNIIVSNLVKVLSNYRVCQGIKNQQVLSYCNQQVVLRKIDPFVSNNKFSENKFYRSPLSILLSSN